MQRSVLCGLLSISFLSLSLFAGAQAVERDRYGVPLFEEKTSSNEVISYISLSAEYVKASEELDAFKQTVKNGGYAAELLRDGTLGGDETYVVIGLNDTGEGVAAGLSDSGSAWKDMVVEAPYNFKSAFVGSPVTTGKEIGDDAVDNWNDASEFCNKWMNRAGRDLKVHRAQGAPYALGKAIVAVSGGTAYLVLKLPVETAIDVTKGILRTTWALTGDPILGTLHFGKASVVGAYGVGSTILGGTFATTV
ncbi:MAG: hypothetical protein HYS98_03415, partial [Deltaproteobacteria bacterium]|nr:hypothetical protein [Deltaproteobacteria bacterium]